ncbi:putative 2OG Fe(II) oxygenase superfamily [Trypanosoma vivax]|uniref:Fe2OG dioxygenase domain-containing protein n=1 Tax=Trypanosoma vivax (strain Y486) TaxID=1055687 RepID=G0TW23_TRYVY|nr:hypothetical protein TRVL_08131 [Trypanosoma vivax]KAH8607097.1 putative 2OG Fe(II) oxygenase superfamily [Trypanosoma vivax]KAH8610598.1 putative 2OG Fe(II) oxygenase superfamily [Trypanosoma vivax]CCC48139.1 conserved hypothetical protein [Trypanosoma vivax Y486]
MYSYNNIVDKREPANKAVIDALQLDNVPPGNVRQRRADERVDVVVVENFLSSEECDRIIAACEEVGYTFWRQKDVDGSRISDVGVTEDEARRVGGTEAEACRCGEAEARAFRVVDTIEGDFPCLCRALSARIETVVHLETKTFSPLMENAEELFARDLEGTWTPLRLASNFLFGRYGPGGHFSPHIDGSTIVDLNTRSFYTLLVYLNDCEIGGETFLFSGEQVEVLERDTQSGKYLGKTANRVGSVKPLKGSAAFFYYDVLHEGSPVGAGCSKYILRGDFLYRRSPPILTAENDRRAFELYEKARVAESNGDVLTACEMFQRVRKLSKGVAELYQL